MCCCTTVTGSNVVKTSDMTPEKTLLKTMQVKFKSPLFYLYLWNFCGFFSGGQLKTNLKSKSFIFVLVHRTVNSQMTNMKLLPVHLESGYLSKVWWKLLISQIKDDHKAQWSLQLVHELQTLFTFSHPPRGRVDILQWFQWSLLLIFSLMSDLISPIFFEHVYFDIFLYVHGNILLFLRLTSRPPSSLRGGFFFYKHEAAVTFAHLLMKSRIRYCIWHNMDYRADS